MTAIDRAAQIVGNFAALAKRLGVTPSMVSQWASGHRPVAIERCVAIETATDGLVRRWDLRPNDWGAIWPELIGAEGAPAWPAEEAQAA
jgi:DNA-binding transcriptional regulator YdaS (Cro superfamily)